MWGAGCRLNPRQQGWLATQSPFALHLSGSTHSEINLLTQAQGKQLVGDTPRRSVCSPPVGAGMPGLVTQPQSTLAAPSAQGQGQGGAQLKP